MTNKKSLKPRLVLASSSQARRKVLDKLKVNYDIFIPQIDERQLPDEPPTGLVERLAVAKASKATSIYANHLIIGSDQTAVVAGKCLGKPINRDHAIQQLEMMSDREVVLLTGLALINTVAGTVQKDVIPYRVTFRKLTRYLIEKYIDEDQPYDCGGSLRSEGLGIVLLKRFDGADPNALLGLPLIRLLDMLAQEGYAVL